MGIRRYTNTVLAFALAAVTLPLSLKAQVLYGSITGNVTDKSGLPMSSAKVEALNTGTGTAKQSTTDSRGAFMFNDLQPGVYKVTISAAAFGTAVENNIQLEANTVRRVDVSLELSQVNQSVTVDRKSVV